MVLLVSCILLFPTLYETQKVSRDQCDSSSHMLKFPLLSSQTIAWAKHCSVTHTVLPAKQTVHKPYPTLTIVWGANMLANTVANYTVLLTPQGSECSYLPPSLWGQIYQSFEQGANNVFIGMINCFLCTFLLALVLTKSYFVIICSLVSRFVKSVKVQLHFCKGNMV